MKAPALLRAAAALLLTTACLAAQQAAPPTAAADRGVGAMAQSVHAFFATPNPNPDPAALTGVIAALNRIGQPGGGPTREEMAPVIQSVQLAADGFAPNGMLKPAPGLASSVKLELLAGPLKAWLTREQKDYIPREQASYSSKLTPQDRQRLTVKMKEMAAALGVLPEDEGVAGAPSQGLPSEGRLAGAPTASLNGISFPTYVMGGEDIARQMARAIDAARTQIQLYDDPKIYPAPVQEALERAAQRNVKILKPEAAIQKPVVHEKRFVLDGALTGELESQEEGALLTEREALSFSNHPQAPGLPRPQAATAAGKPDTWKTNLLWAAALLGTILFVPLVIWLRVNYLP